MPSFWDSYPVAEPTRDLPAQAPGFWQALAKSLYANQSGADQSAAFMPEPQSMPAGNLVSGAAHMLTGMATLPQRAFEASENMRQGNGYDPGPALESALMTMGGTSLSAPGAALGAGPVRRFGPKDVSGPAKSIDELMAERAAAMQGYESARAAEIAADIKAGRVPKGSTETFAEQQAAALSAKENAALAAEDALSQKAGNLPAPQRLRSSLFDAYRKNTKDWP